MSHSQGCRVQLNIERVLMTMIKEGKSAKFVKRRQKRSDRRTEYANTNVRYNHDRREIVHGIVLLLEVKNIYFVGDGEHKECR